MSYGGTGGPTTFQLTMNSILAPLFRKCVVVYIDDILIYSQTWEDHIEREMCPWAISKYFGD
jgi:hypothetical protein